MSSNLIRLGGLMAMVGGFAATALGLLYVLDSWGMTLDFTALALRKGHYQSPVATMLLVGVLAAIVALHVVQRYHYGRWGALASIASFAGVAMVVAAVVDMVLLILGVAVASVGIVGLGIVTISAGVLPRWCGV